MSAAGLHQTLQRSPRSTVAPVGPPAVRMFCDECEVAWRGESSSDCWVCGDVGEVGRLRGSGRLDR